jgi:hypothetical protein
MKHDHLFDFFSQPLLETFFCLFDRDSSGLLSESEWIGSIYKVTEYVYIIFSFILSQQTFDQTYLYIYRISNRTKDVRTLEPFIRAFRHISRGYDSLSINDFFILFEDTSVCSLLIYRHRMKFYLLF